MEHELKTSPRRSRSAGCRATSWCGALVDETFRLELDRRLADVGLRLLDNPTPPTSAWRCSPNSPNGVRRRREYAASNLGLTRDEIALLVIIWALIVLPKRSAR